MSGIAGIPAVDSSTRIYRRRYILRFAVAEEEAPIMEGRYEILVDFGRQADVIVDAATSRTSAHSAR